MNTEHKRPAKWMECWRRKRPGLALFGALLVGAVGVLCVRLTGTRVFHENHEKEGAVVALAGRVVNGSELEDRQVGASGVEQLLRGEADDSSAEDRRRVWAFLRESCCQGVLGRHMDLFAADEAFTWLRGAVDSAAEIETELMRLGADCTLPEMLRCFALQHLGMWAEGHPLGANTVAQLRAASGDLAAGGVGVTALRILNRLRASAEDAEWLRGRVLELLEAVDCPSEQRVAALQIAVDLEAEEVEPIARRLVEPGRQVAERVNAFLALGRLGNVETLRWLRSQPQPHESLVLEAMEGALRTLAKR